MLKTQILLVYWQNLHFKIRVIFIFNICIFFHHLSIFSVRRFQNTVNLNFSEKWFSWSGWMSSFILFLTFPKFTCNESEFSFNLQKAGLLVMNILILIGNFLWIQQKSSDGFFGEKITNFVWTDKRKSLTADHPIVAGFSRCWLWLPKFC